MARFKKGQEVVCIATGDWYIVNRQPWYRKILNKIFSLNSICPKTNEIVTVEFYSNDIYIALKEYQQLRDGKRICFHEDNFYPVANIAELTDILESQPAEV